MAAILDAKEVWEAEDARETEDAKEVEEKTRREDGRCAGAVMPVNSAPQKRREHREKQERHWRGLGEKQHTRKCPVR